MNKQRMMAVVCLAVFLPVCMGGCTSNGPTVDMNRVMENFYSQQRSCKSLTLTGVSDLQLRGSNITLAVESPLPALSAMPSDPNRTLMLMDAAKNIVLGGLGIWALKDMATQKPTVIQQPAPLVVHPDVIQNGALVSP